MQSTTTETSDSGVKEMQSTTTETSDSGVKEMQSTWRKDGRFHRLHLLVEFFV